MADDSEAKRGPGRPRKWADDAERMRAYRTRVAHERNIIKAGGTYVEMAEQIAELTRQRDKNWDQVTRLQEQIKTLKRDQPARPKASRRVEFDNPDAAAEASFEAPADTHRGAPDHADCDAEIGRLENELAASERHNVDLSAIVRKLEATNGDLASRLIAATNMPATTPSPAGQSPMSRAQRREAERQAKRKQRRS